jgi:hypothetical protein
MPQSASTTLAHGKAPRFVGYRHQQAADGSAAVSLNGE